MNNQDNIWYYIDCTWDDERLWEVESLLNISII